MAAALEEVRERFKGAYGRRAARDRAVLAELLLTTSREAGLASRVRYAMLQEAAANAAAAGNVPAALAAVDDVAANFKLSGAEAASQRVATLTAASGAVK